MTKRRGRGSTPKLKQGKSPGASADFNRDFRPPLSFRESQAPDQTPPSEGLAIRQHHKQAGMK